MTNRIFLNIKQRSPLNTIKPIAYISKSNSDRPSPPTKPDRLSPQNQTAIAPQHHKPDRLFPIPNSDRPFNTHKPDRLFPQHQTAIAPHHSQT
jgi:hypothetical protein